MMHILLLPLGWAARGGQWINDHVLSPFQIGTTAKQVTEEEIGCFGVLSYLIFKVSHLLIESWPLLEPRWLPGRIARGVGLVSALILSAWLLTCGYVGLLIRIRDLNVSYTGLVLAPVIGWIVLAYVLLAEHVRAQRAEQEAQSEVED